MDSSDVDIRADSRPPTAACKLVVGASATAFMASRRGGGRGRADPSRKIQNPNPESRMRMAARMQGPSHVKIQIANLESRLGFLQSCRIRIQNSECGWTRWGSGCTTAAQTQNPESGIQIPSFLPLGIWERRFAFSHLFYSLLCRSGVQNSGHENPDGFCKVPYMVREARR